MANWSGDTSSASPGAVASNDAASESVILPVGLIISLELHDFETNMLIIIIPAIITTPIILITGIRIFLTKFVSFLGFLVSGESFFSTFLPG